MFDSTNAGDSYFSKAKTSTPKIQKQKLEHHEVESILKKPYGICEKLKNSLDPRLIFTNGMPRRHFESFSAWEYLGRDASAEEIGIRLNLEKRTVDGHMRKASKIVAESIGLSIRRNNETKKWHLVNITEIRTRIHKAEKIYRSLEKKAKNLKTDIDSCYLQTGFRLDSQVTKKLIQGDETNED